MEKSRISELHEQIAELNRQLMAEYQVSFKEKSKELFKKYPYLDKFSWVQYTPYFNDGDECVFSVSSEPRYVTINGVEFDELYISTKHYNKDLKKYIDLTDEEINEGFIDGEKTDADNVMTRKEVSQMIGDIEGFLASFDEDYMKESFGDHCIVTLSKDGNIENDEYEHE